MESANRFYNYVNCELDKMTTYNTFISKSIEATKLFEKEIKYIASAKSNGSFIMLFKDSSVIVSLAPLKAEDEILIYVTTADKLLDPKNANFSALQRFLSECVSN